MAIFFEGVGKSALVEHVLRTAGSSKIWRDNVVVVKLSGHIQVCHFLNEYNMTMQNVDK